MLKVESSAHPDLGRRLPTKSVHHPETLNTNGYFNQYGQGTAPLSGLASLTGYPGGGPEEIDERA